MTGRRGGTPERPALFFEDAAEWRAWLAEHHATDTELWMGLNRAHVTPRGLTWADAVLEALCFGWIDSVMQRIDADTNRQRWTPRRKGSNWSLVNVGHAERLIAEGRMTPAGLAAFEARTGARTGIYSFELPAEPALTPQQEAALAAVPAAKAWWDAAQPAYRRTAAHWLNSAKQDATRQRRLAQLVEDSAAGRLVPPLRYGDEPAWVVRNRSSLGLG